MKQVQILTRTCWSAEATAGPDQQPSRLPRRCPPHQHGCPARRPCGGPPDARPARGPDRPVHDNGPQGDVAGPETPPWIASPGPPLAGESQAGTARRGAAPSHTASGSQILCASSVYAAAPQAPDLIPIFRRPETPLPTGVRQAIGSAYQRPGSVRGVFPAAPRLRHLRSAPAGRGPSPACPVVKPAGSGRAGHPPGEDGRVGAEQQRCGSSCGAMPSTCPGALRRTGRAEEASDRTAPPGGYALLCTAGNLLSPE
jgi:hypothetical protein